MGHFIEEIIDKDLASGKVKKVKVRFPPEPNGYLHIGHAKAICINLGLAKKYNGTINLRFDDTNPVKEDVEYVDAIIEDVKWLGNVDKILFASDYFDVMYNTAIKLIKKGLAYVDDITPDEMRKMRGTLTQKGIESKNRNRPIAESLQLFKDMKNGKVADGALVLRAKIDMSSPNMNMRDPVIYRVLKTHHHKQGDKWCIYPMYDFAHPIGDAVEEISHSCCTLEFEDHRPLYDWVVVNGEFDSPPHQYEFARLNLKRTIMSKRYLKKLVDEGVVSGWDDPRMPTLKGLRRRGYTASSIREFCLRSGVAKANSEVHPNQLEACIREELNASSERAMAVLDPLEVILENVADSFSEKLPFEYEILENGEQVKRVREITLSNRIYIEREDFLPEKQDGFFRLTIGGLVRLKAGYIIEGTRFETDKNGKVVKVFAKLIEGTKSGHIAPDAPKCKGVIHWVDAKNCIDIKAMLYDYLLVDEDEQSLENQEQKQDFMEKLNPNSLAIANGKAEPFLSKAEKGTHFQFLRLGYFVRDSVESVLVFNKTVGLKDNDKVKVKK
ncbi:MAG: glutamine--tRNA ligase/YqeY domain fusion protein [Firmicutes bacterium]|nr:glutamine--tRNA ligase/YqeY domain fusion protein [Bacillota bacterium]